MTTQGTRGGRRGTLALIANQPYMLLTLTMLLWSGNVVLGRAVVAGHIPPLALAQMRWTLALVILLPFTWRHLGRDWPAIRASWRILVLLGAFGIAGYNTLVYVGLQSTTAVNATVLSSIFPMVIAAVGYVIYRDTLTLPQILGILVGATGATMILSGGYLSVLTQLRFTPGDLWVLAAQFVYALYTVTLRERPLVHPLSFLTVVVFVGQALLVPFSLGEALAGRHVPLDLVTAGAAVYTALFASVIAYLCFNRGVAILGSNRAGPFFHLLPVFGSAMGVGLLGESIGLHHVAGWGLILCGIAAAQLGRRQGAIR